MSSMTLSRHGLPLRRVQAVRWMHLIAMAFFVGGQIFLAAVVVPVERKSPDRERLRRMARRFGYGTLLAIAVLIATGISMASYYHRWADGELHVKLALVVLVGLLVLRHIRRPESHVEEGLIFVGSLAIVWLGVAIAH
jgi:putative copper export protein